MIIARLSYPNEGHRSANVPRENSSRHRRFDARASSVFAHTGQMHMQCRNMWQRLT